MPSQRFTGKVEQGRLILDDPERWKAYLSGLVGRRFEVSIQPERKHRTSAQNRYYWSVVVPLFGEWTGEDKDDAHETLKSIHLMVDSILPTGELVRKPGRSSELSTVEFSEYVERVCVWLAQQGVFVPPPNYVEANPGVPTSNSAASNAVWLRGASD